MQAVETCRCETPPAACCEACSPGCHPCCGYAPSCCQWPALLDFETPTAAPLPRRHSASQTSFEALQSEQPSPAVCSHASSLGCQASSTV